MILGGRRNGTMAHDVRIIKDWRALGLVLRGQTESEISNLLREQRASATHQSSAFVRDCGNSRQSMHLPPLVRHVLDSLHGPHGYLSRELRVAASDHAALSAGARREVTALPLALTPYVDKVSLTPYKVTDRDIAALAQAGLNEDQIFELTVVTAVGAALGRLEKTLELLEEAPT